jgi:hypothetical protein
MHKFLLIILIVYLFLELLLHYFKVLIEYYCDVYVRLKLLDFHSD